MEKFRTILLTTMFAFIMTITAFAGEFGVSHYDKDGTPKWVYFENNIPVTNTWIQNQKENWYYCGADGYLLRETWFHDPSDGKYYYLGSDWSMLHDTTTPDDYTVGSDGAWIKDGQVVIVAVTNN